MRLSTNQNNYIYRLKVSPEAEKLNVEKSPQSCNLVKVEKVAGSRDKNKKCPRCEEDFTLKQIEDIFGVLNSHKSFRQKIIDNLNKYIKQKKEEGKLIHLNTCLRKAHFLSQIGAETLGIHPDWMVETDVMPYSTSNITSSLFGARGQKLKTSGNLETYCEERPQKKLLNYLYAKENGFGNGNGDEASGDGYLFRGRGLKQLTGRGNYKKATKFLEDVFPKEYIDLEANPDKVKEAKYAVLTAIAYWEKNKIWVTADQVKESSDSGIKRVRRRVNGGIAGWQESKTHFEKAVEILNIDLCEKDGVNIVDINVYEIDFIKQTYEKVKDFPLNKKYKYDVFRDGILEKSFVLSKNKNGYLKFPDIGSNWGRYGTRDKGITSHGDNWIEEKCAAALLGFFFNIKEKGLEETLYFNDISAHDGSTDLGHKTHKTGKDIDIRYPGCTNNSGEELWTVARDYYGSEEKLDEIMKKIYEIAIKWDFVNNYHYKEFDNTKKVKAATHKVHENHFHIGHK